MGFPRTLLPHQQKTIELFVKNSAKFDIVNFSEFHTLQFCFGWFVVNVLPLLPSIGIKDWVTEYFNLKVGEDQKRIVSLLSEFSFETFMKMFLDDKIRAYRLRTQEELGYDIGSERANKEYYLICKTQWLKTQLSSGQLPSLRQNYVWMKNLDELLLGIIVAVEHGINFHGATTPDMNVQGGISLFDSYVKVTELGKEAITKLRRQNKKVVGYFGVPHGNVKESGIIYFKLKELGKNWISKHKDLSSVIEGVSYRDCLFSFAPDLVEKGEKFLNVLLLICAEEDLRRVRYKSVMEEISHLVQNLRVDPYIEHNETDRTTTITMLERPAKTWQNQI